MLAVTACCCVALRFIVLKTKIGMAMRALSFNPEAAALMGINTDMVISFTFGARLGAGGGGGNSVRHQLSRHRSAHGHFARPEGVRRGGARRHRQSAGRGAGRIIIGVTETFVSGYISSTYRDAIAFGVLILILLVKPAGLLGKLEVEKV